MSLKRCLPEMENDGRLNRQQGQRLRDLYDDLEAEYRGSMSPEAADAKASLDAVAQFEAETALKRRQEALQIKAQQRISADVRSYRGDDKAAAAAAIFTSDPDKAPYANVEYQAKAIEGQAHQYMRGVLERFSRNVVGKIRDHATLMDVVREAFGEDTGNLAAKELAEAWGQTSDWLRSRFNEAGGAIGKIERWGMPQVHNALALRAVSYEQWRDFIRPLLDIGKMRDAQGVAMTAGRLELALRDVFENIRTEGWVDRTPGAMGQGKKLGNRHQDHRFLVFKDADSWLEYARTFGRPTSDLAAKWDSDGPIYDAMMGHISGMSREIALMERLGPNPAATVRWLKDGLQQSTALSADPTGRLDDAAKEGARRIDQLYGELSGVTGGVVNRKIALGFSAFRSIQTASKLGSATLSAVTDIAFQQVTRRFNGLPQAGILRDYVKLLSSKEDRRLAMRLGLIAEQASQMATNQARFTGEVLTGEVAARLAEGVMRLSGLGAWTQAGRWAFGMEFMSHVTSQSGRAWDNLDAPFRRTLDRYGFDQLSWDRLRASPTEEAAGSQWIMPENIADQDIRDRLMRMILTETDYAVPTASIRMTSVINNTFEKGTWVGEAGRSILQFKAFPITVLMMHGRRILEQEGFDKLTYAANLAIATTLMGALAIQLKQTADGKDPEPMDDPTFWGRSFVQGGGAGIMGDFLKSSTSRFGNDLYTTALGPTVTTAADTINVVKSSNPERDLLRFLWQNTPGQSLWYSKLAAKRTLADQLQAQIDPDYHDSFGRMEARAAEYGTEFWWRPGEVAPDRTPDLTNALPE